MVCPALEEDQGETGSTNKYQDNMQYIKEIGYSNTKKNSFYLPLYLALLMKIFNHITEMLHLRLIQVNIIILGGEETKMEDINVTLNHFPSVVCQRKKSNGETCCKCV